MVFGSVFILFSDLPKGKGVLGTYETGHWGHETQGEDWDPDTALQGGFPENSHIPQRAVRAIVRFLEDNRRGSDQP